MVDKKSSQPPAEKLAQIQVYGSERGLPTGVDQDGKFIGTPRQFPEVNLQQYEESIKLNEKPLTVSKPSFKIETVPFKTEFDNSSKNQELV